ncbi:hypothetical protein [Kineococcus sp. SYSU DK001]|uniref:hypothetical protein n=1 Tax=Kineococcus sp. SYSU DK001 TaxID=3383122 RepID=UPI003D7E65CB
MTLASGGTPVIRRAERSDTEQVLTFLDRHWRRDHVFARRPALFAWQHLEGEHLNVVLAQDGEEVVGLLGYLPVDHFDPALAGSGPAVALAVWKVVEERGGPGLGLQLLNHLRRVLRPRLVFAVGLSETVIPLYRALRWTVGVMDHHVLPNPAARDRVIAPGLAGLRPARATDDGGRLLGRWGRADALPAGLEAVTRCTEPVKSVRYLTERYLRHPEYDYEVVAVGTPGRTPTLLVLRRVSVGTAAALRVVDVVGPTDGLSVSGRALLDLLEDSGAEYLDVQHHGLAHDHLAAAGFTDRRAVPGLVVPGYFEPFEARNVDLDFAHRRYAAPDGADHSIPLRLLRGDTDQDRPNL